MVEARCKHVVADRLKKSGMGWSVRGVNAILQLRVCILNQQMEFSLPMEARKIQNGELNYSQIKSTPLQEAEIPQVFLNR